MSLWIYAKRRSIRLRRRKQARRFVVVNRTAAPFADVGIMQSVGYCKPTLQVGQMKRFLLLVGVLLGGDASNNRLFLHAYPMRAQRLPSLLRRKISCCVDRSECASDECVPVVEPSAMALKVFCWDPGFLGCEDVAFGCVDQFSAFCGTRVLRFVKST